MAEVPETSTFTTFLLVFKWVKSAIFQINTDPTKLARNWYFYTLYLTPFFISPLQRFLEISTFNHIFTTLNSEVRNISNKC